MLANTHGIREVLQNPSVAHQTTVEQVRLDVEAQIQIHQEEDRRQTRTPT